MPVTIVRCEDYHLSQIEEALEALLAPLGGWETFIQPGDRVLMKPNLISVSRPEEGAITHPVLVQAVARAIKRAGGHPLVGDSPAFYTLKQVLRAGEYLPMLEEEGIPILEFHQPITVSHPLKVPPLRFKVAQEVLSVDKIINLPKLKTHRQLGFTGATKNLYACMPGKRKAFWHMKAGWEPTLFCSLLLGVAEVVHPVLNITDAIVAMEHDGPKGGDPRRLGLLVAGTNYLEVDRILAEILSLPESHRLVLKTADSLQEQRDTLEEILLVGGPLERLKVPNFRHSRLVPIGFTLPRVLRSTLKNWYLSHQSESQGI